MDEFQDGIDYSDPNWPKTYGIGIKTLYCSFCTGQSFRIYRELEENKIWYQCEECESEYTLEELENGQT